MDDSSDVPTMRSAAAAGITEDDRRRPGRSSDVAPALVPLLRSDTLAADAAGLAEDVAPAPPIDDHHESDGVRVFVGVLVGALMATPFWILLGILIWWMMN